MIPKLQTRLATACVSARRDRRYGNSVSVSVMPCNVNNNRVSSLKEAIWLDDFSLFLLMVFHIVVRSL
jgi:hypothetical protein